MGRGSASFYVHSIYDRKRERRDILRGWKTKTPVLRMPHYSWSSFTVKLSQFREDAFVGLESLEWLKLEDNSLTTLGGDELFPKTMKVTNSL